MHRAEAIAHWTSGLFLLAGLFTAIRLRRMVAGLLRESERSGQEKVRMVDHSLDIICSIDAAGCFTGLNAASACILGYTADELKGRPCLDLVHPDDVEKTRAVLAAIMAGQATNDFENRWWHKDGRAVDLLWSASWSEPDQKVFGVGREITERKRTERQIKRSEERLQEAQQVAHIGSWEWDIHTDEVIWSDEEFRLFGFEPGEVVVNSDFHQACVHPDDRAAVAEWISKVIRDRVPSSSEYHIVHPHGEVRLILSRAHPITDRDGSMLRLIGTSQDVTEMRRVEQELQETNVAAAVGQGEERYSSLADALP
jgi:PAS domain S-box-containing protein